MEDGIGEETEEKGESKRDTGMIMRVGRENEMK